MLDDTDVNIPKNKKLLEKLREEGEKTDGSRNNGLSSKGHAESGRSGNQQNARGIAGLDRRDQGGTQGNESTAGASEGRSEGIRSTNGAGEYASEGAYSGSGRTQGHLSIVESPQEKADRERELTRQRVQRFRDRKREELEAQNATLRNPVTDGPQFNLKLPFMKRTGQINDKLFSDKEADAELERMKDIYFRGSGLLDDVLEIIVKDHESVQIWQLSEEEAETLAGMHLERAKKDKAAARSARKLLEIYDRLYFWMIVAPRVKATGSHIARHKGLGFR